MAGAIPGFSASHSDWVLLVISLITFLSTLFGGLFAMRFQDQLHLILGFSAGAVLGVVFFDLFPESLALGSDIFGFFRICTVGALGFLLYMILDRLALLHVHKDHPRQGQRGSLGAGSLSIHSLLDGIAIGIAFQVSSTTGLIVAVAVIVHDFSDGINTVGIVLKSSGRNREAFRWLIVDSLAPVLGIASTFLFRIPASSFSLILALFAGFFLYIGASDLLPESQHKHPTFWTSFMTLLGAGIIYLAISLAS